MCQHCVKNKVRVYDVNAQSEFEWNIWQCLTWETVTHHANCRLFILNYSCNKLLFEWTLHKNSFLELWEWLNSHKLRNLTRILTFLNSLSVLHIRTADDIWMIREQNHDIWICEWHKSSHIKNLSTDKLSQTEVSSQLMHCMSKVIWDKICIRQILTDLLHKTMKKLQWESDEHCVL